MPEHNDNTCRSVSKWAEWLRRGDDARLILKMIGNHVRYTAMHNAAHCRPGRRQADA